MIDKAPAQVTMSLDPKAIEDMLRQTITIQIANILSGKGEAFIQEMVRQTLDAKCDGDGKPSNSSYNTQPFITYIARHAIQEGVKAAIIEWRTENVEKIKAAFKKQIAKNPSHIINKLVDGTIEKFCKDSYYGLRIDVGPHS